MSDIPPEMLPFPVDDTLTPENSVSQGYKWLMDVLRDEKTLRIVEKAEIERMVNEEGCKLGQPWGNNLLLTPYGLYKPLVQSNQPQKIYD